jgi:hypothetical protein
VSDDEVLAALLRRILFGPDTDTYVVIRERYVLIDGATPINADEWAILARAHLRSKLVDDGAVDDSIAARPEYAEREPLGEVD